MDTKKIALYREVLHNGKVGYIYNTNVTDISYEFCVKFYDGGKGFFWWSILGDYLDGVEILDTFASIQIIRTYKN